MEYITRQEKYLAYLAQLKTGKLPAPQTREEIYLAAIAGLYKKPLPYPQTRVETYLKAIADGKTTGLPEPRTRKEYYLYAIAADDTERYIPTPITREEQLLDKVVNILVGVEDVTVSGNGSVMLYNAANHGFTGLTLYGKSTQGSTTGAQLFDASLLKNTSSASVKCNGSDIIITALADGEYRKASGVSIGFFEKGDQICIAAKAFPKDNAVVLRDSNGVNNINVIISNKLQSVTIPDNGTYLAILCINKSVPVKAGTVGVFSELIINKGNVPKDYEPYTGGKPSPSPSYPQEIESVGDAGEIGVEVGGVNLLDLSKCKTINVYNLYCIIDGDVVSITGKSSSTRKMLSFRFLDTGQDLSGKKTHITIIKQSGVQTLATRIDYANNTIAIDITLNEIGGTVDLKFKVMVTLKNVGVVPYEPYKPVQKLIVPTPNGLPGIPVSSGGNYTDEKGQQWVADEIDLAKGERVQRIGEYGFTGAEVWNSWGVNKYTEGITGFHWYFKNTLSTVQKRILNTHAVFSDNAWGGREEGTVAITDLNDKYITWSVRNEYLEDISDNNVAIESFKKMLGEINAKMLYCLAEPIRTPLPPETIAAYKKLHTYSPTTTVINDAGADMKITYRCNLKKTESELEALYADTQQEFKAITETEDKE
nr:MAG TPA: hypothetical protein [Caudoviricetes sp.]